MTRKAKIRDIKQFIPKDESNNLMMDKFYTYLLIILFLLKQISPESTRPKQFKKFLKDNNQIDKSRMGFPNNWEEKIEKFESFLNS